MNSIDKRLPSEHQFFLEVKETRVWESVAVLLNVHEELRGKTYSQVKIGNRGLDGI